MNIVITDPVFIKKENKNVIDRFFLKLINDERDLPFIYLCLKITFLVVPAAVFLFVNKHIHWAFYVLYLVINLAVFLGPFVLMLHNTSHRKFFKKEYGFLNNFIPWFLGLFYGQTPETYFYHHVGMHHAENNMEDDLSSTMKYRRDSLRGFLHYLFTFYFFGIFQLSYYFKKKDQVKFLWRVLRGETFFIILTIALAFYNFTAALFILILPFIFIRFAMMAGNWAQHAFIDRDEPDNLYKSSITCINTGYNKRCFNDGYHIGHHLKPSMHWTDMPGNFLQNLDKYENNDVVIFEGVDYFQIWFLLMIKNYKFLAKKFVSVSQNLRSEQEIIDFLKSRTRYKFTSK